MKRAISNTLFKSVVLLFAGTSLMADESPQRENAGAPDQEIAEIDENSIVDSRPLSPRARRFMEEQRQREEMEDWDEAHSDEIDLSALMVPIKNSKDTAVAGLMVPIKNSKDTAVAGLMVPIKNSKDTAVAGLMVPIKNSKDTAVAGLMVPIKNSKDTAVAGLMVPIKNSKDTAVAGLMVPIKNSKDTAVAGLMVPIKNTEVEAPESVLQLAGLMVPIKNHGIEDLLGQEMYGTASSFSSHIYHWVASIPQDNVVKLEDGSEWIFEQADIARVRAWRPSDVVVITPKAKGFWGSNYAYVLTNKNEGSSINVNPFLGPIKFGPHSTWVVGIDYNSNHVYLLNGQGDRTVWEVSNADRYLFHEWKTNDLIIVGEDSSWLSWFSGHNKILFNVDMNHHVRAETVSQTPFARPAPGA